MIHTIRGTYVPRLLEHLRAPLYRNGYALILSSGASSALGFIYWIVAAQAYSPETVGLNSAALSALTFLANVAQLNLGNAFNRFLPSSGQQARRFILSTYSITVVVSIIGAVLFLVGINAWAPRLSFLTASPLLIVGFVVSVVAWLIFILQDSVLVGLRQATWVPVKNIVFAVAKVALLIALAASLPDVGIVAAWIIPVMISLFPVNYLIFKRLMPRHIQETQHRAIPITRRQIVQYATGDYVGSLITTATIDLLPIIIVERVTASANAYFFLAWTIAYALYLFSRNMGMSLIAEAALEPEKLYTYSYRVFIQTARLLVPLVAIGVIGAPLILVLFGESYAAQAPDLLRLLCLSAIPNIIVQTYLSIARVQRKVTALIVVQGALCISVMGQTFLLLDDYGITGVGLAWLSSQTIMAIVLLLTRLRTAWIHEINVDSVLRVLAIPRRGWWLWKHREDVRQASQLLPSILPAVAEAIGDNGEPSWTVQRLLPTLNDVSVLTLGTPHHAPVAVLKLSRSAAATNSMKRQATVLRQLHADERLDGWRAYLPQILTTAENDSPYYVVERTMQGELASVYVKNRPTSIEAQSAALDCISQLHLRTRTLRTADDAFLSEKIGKAANVLRAWNANHHNSIDFASAVDRLETELRAAWDGHVVAVSWMHGDFSPDNIMMTDSGKRVSGILDWELANPDDLPQLDTMHFLLSCRMYTRKQELGDILRELLTENSWTEYERMQMERAQSTLSTEPIEMRTLALYTWLRHVANNLEKSSHYASHWLWMKKNVEGVLVCV